MHIGKRAIIDIDDHRSDIVSIRADPTVPIEHTVGALAELVKLGDSFAFTACSNKKITGKARSSTSASVNPTAKHCDVRTRSTPSRQSKWSTPRLLWTRRTRRSGP